MSDIESDITEIIDDTVATWRTVRPDLDFGAMEMFLRLSTITRLVAERAGSRLRELDLTLSEFDVLATLRRNGAAATLTPSHIAHVAMVKPSGLSSRLARLEDAGLIERTLAPDDRRSWLISITTRGRRVVDRAIEILVEVTDDSIGTIDPALQRSVRRFVDGTLVRIHDSSGDPT